MLSLWNLKPEPETWPSQDTLKLEYPQVAFDGFRESIERQLFQEDDFRKLLQNLPAPKKGWAKRNPDAALARLYVTHRDDGTIDELIAE